MQLNLEDQVRREGLSNYLQKMQKLLKVKEDQMFDQNEEGIQDFGVMNNDAFPINSKIVFGNINANYIQDFLF